MSDPAAPVAGLPYHEVHLAGRAGWWRPVVGTFALVVVMLGLVPLLVQIPFALGYAVAGDDLTASMKRLVDLEHPTPAGLAYLNLVLAAAIPVTWAVQRLVHGLRPGWLASIRPRLRWGWFATCLGLALVSLVATLVVSALLPSSSSDPQVNSHLNSFTDTTRGFLLVVLFLTPLQAAGEEYAFRGYLTQAFGGLFRNRVAAVVGPAVLFALAHGAQSAPVFFDRFAFGLVAGVLVISTGGLEAGIAMHVLNNWLAFGLALAFGDMGSTLNPTGGSWWTIPVTLTQSLVYLALALLVARRTGVRTAAERAVLLAPKGRV